MSWIKMRHNLDTDPDVLAISEATGLDEFAVIGRLWKVWTWADQHSISGNAVRVTDVTLDRFTSTPGFAKAMRAVGWLEGDSGSLTFPKFERHNGQTAKNRGLTANRVAFHRNATTVTNVTQQPLPDKRREDKKKDPQPPTSPSARKAGLIPKSEEGKRIAAVFHRSHGTAWSTREVARFKELLPISDDDLCMIERCYAKQWPPDREKNILRHDIGTFLNNFQTEVERARIWCAKHPARGSVTLKVLPSRPPELTDEQIEKNKAVIAEHMGALNAKMNVREA